MKLQSRFLRFLTGFLSVLLVCILGFGWVSSAIPTWGATMDEVNLSLPGDQFVPEPQFSWNHAITIKATPENIYPWLIQIGDTRGAYYSFTFIENLFNMAGKSPDRYANASRIHPEWQNPPIGQGMIMDFMALKEYQKNEYVLSSATPEMGDVQWTWLWYLQPVDEVSTRLIVRHRFHFPENTPGIAKTMIDLGFVMERGMILGIRNRAEGKPPFSPQEPLEIVLWLVALACGLTAAVRYVKHSGRYSSLVVGIEAVITLFIFTYIQPAIWLRILIDLVLIACLVITYLPGKSSRQ